MSQSVRPTTWTIFATEMCDTNPHRRTKTRMRNSCSCKIQEKIWKSQWFHSHPYHHCLSERPRQMETWARHEPETGQCWLNGEQGNKGQDGFMWYHGGGNADNNKVTDNWTLLWQAHWRGAWPTGWQMGKGAHWVDEGQQHQLHHEVHRQRTRRCTVATKRRGHSLRKSRGGKNM